MLQPIYYHAQGWLSTKKGTTAFRKILDIRGLRDILDIRKNFGGESMNESSTRKSPWRFLFLAIAVLSGAWLAFYAALQLFARYWVSAGEQAGIGIIGGADGPTAIFVTTAPGFDWDPAIMAAVLVVGIVGYVRLRKCKRNN